MQSLNKFAFPGGVPGQFDLPNYVFMVATVKHHHSFI